MIHRGGAQRPLVGLIRSSAARESASSPDVAIHPPCSRKLRAIVIDHSISLEQTPALDPTALARFGRLELLARLVVEGVMSGLHKSPFKGFSVEFAEHRQYGPGDEIRHIDWRAYGKTDRYFVKEYEEETNLKAYLVVDTSGSMSFAGASLSKFEYTRRFAAALAYLMISQRDAVGLITFDSSVKAMIPARTAPGHFSVLCNTLEHATIGGETPLSGILHTLAERIRRRGLVVILSDGFDRIGDLVSSLRHLRHRKHEVLFFQIMAPEEESFPFRRPMLFRNLERADHRVRIDPAAVRASYIEKLTAHNKALRDELRGIDADYHKVLTNQPHDRALLDYLANRARRGGTR